MTESALATRLRTIITELEQQRDALDPLHSPAELSFDDTIDQLKECVDEAREYEVAYEIIVATLECKPVTISGISAVALLELGLLLRYKTDRAEDSDFDLRPPVPA
jgi:hypothetical protein